MIVASETCCSSVVATAAPVERSSIDCADGILDCIGQTPLVRLRRYLDVGNVELFAKLEALNPGGSAKDRSAAQMLHHALATGELHAGCTVVESSSGNMGIGLAQACRFHGLRFICVVDSQAQPQNVAIIRALGGEVVTVTRPVRGSFLVARLQRVESLLKATPQSYWPNQYANRQNPRAHELSTIREVYEATGGDFDCLVVATSSTGTAQGCRDFLCKRDHPAKVVVVDAHGSVLFGGSPGKRLMPGLGAGAEPSLARGQSFDQVIRVSDIDCVVGCRRAAEREAILVGGSSGGVLEAVRSMQLARAGERCVAVLHDSGTRYLDTIFDDHWTESVLGIDRQSLAARIDQPALPC